MAPTGNRYSHRQSGRLLRRPMAGFCSGVDNLDRQIDHPPPGRQEDMATELKRLRRENEVLRQEGDILKRATAFSPGREVDEVPAHRYGERGVPRSAHVHDARRSQSGYLPGRPAPPVAVSETTWCCWPTSARPSPCRFGTSAHPRQNILGIGGTMVQRG